MGKQYLEKKPCVYPREPRFLEDYLTMGVLLLGIILLKENPEGSGAWNV